MLVCVPEPARNLDKNTQLRRPGVLAGAEAAVEGTIRVVAEWEGGHPEVTGSPGAVAVGGGQPGGGRGTGVAKGGHVEKIAVGSTPQKLSLL
jgi:hypothetical protein